MSPPAGPPTAGVRAGAPRSRWTCWRRLRGARGAHVDHYRHAKFLDRLEQPGEPGVIHAVAPHDRVEVEAKHAVLGDRPSCLDGRLPAAQRVDRPPGLDEGVRVTVAQSGDVL